MEDIKYRKLGVEKQTDFTKKFDHYIEKYKNKAEELDLKGDLKFIKERGKVIIYVQLDL